MPSRTNFHYNATPLSRAMPPKLGLALGLAATLLAGHASAVVFDTFETGTAANDNAATRGDDAGDPNDVPFFANQPASSVNPTLSIDVNNAINPFDVNDNQALFVDVQNTSQGTATRVGTVIAPLGATYTLNNVGDKLTLSLKWQKATTFGGIGSYFALINDGGTPATADNALNLSDDSGYLANIGNPGGANAGFSAIGSFAGSLDSAATGSDSVDLGSTGFKNDGSVQNVLLTLERVVGGMQVDAAWTASNTGSVTSLSGLDTTSPVFSFNQIGLTQQTSGMANDFWVDDVTVTFIPAPVPEPASLVLAGLGAMCLIRRRRRCR